MRKILSIVLALVMVFGTVATAFADTSKGSATTLRLEKTEGKVEVKKSGGKSVSVKEGMRLYDGYEIKTAKSSSAYISLDSSKAVKLDASTNVTIKKSGKKLEIMLKSGTVLVNVEDRLAGNEELNIRTTNSVTGIRGTILQASYIPRTGNTELYLFEGETIGTYLAPDGTWYTQKLTTGSWLASGTGLLTPNSEFNGWVKQDNTWIYINNKLTGSESSSLCWNQDNGWFTLNNSTGEAAQREAWPFEFKDLPPMVQLEILNNPSMLERGREHLDLYPELAEEGLEEIITGAEEALARQREAADKRDAEIGQTVAKGKIDELFEEKPVWESKTYTLNIENDQVATLSNISGGTQTDADKYTVTVGADFSFTLDSSYKVTASAGGSSRLITGSRDENSNGETTYSIPIDRHGDYTVTIETVTELKQIAITIDNPDNVTVELISNNVLYEETLTTGYGYYIENTEPSISVLITAHEGYIIENVLDENKVPFSPNDRGEYILDGNANVTVVEQKP